MGNNENELPALLDRMRAGDRQAAATFLSRFGARIHRRVSGKLGSAMRRLFDSQEIMSTVARRLDQFVRAGRVEAGSIGELWSLVVQIADHSLAEKARVFRALERREGEDGPFADLVRQRMRAAEIRASDGPEIEVDRALRHLSDPCDREILSLWLTGHSHVQTAELMGMAPTAIRKRWQGIREQLRNYFEGQLHGQS